MAKTTAVLAARIGMAAFAHAMLAWLDHPEPALPERLETAASELKTLTLDFPG